MSSTNTNRPYQGYPYVNPTVTDAPSIDAETAARWTNLPRRAVNPSAVTLPFPGATGENSQNEEKRISDRPVVYIDIPDNQNDVNGDNNTLTRPSNNDTPIQTQPQKRDRKQQEIDDLATVYIDLPEDDGGAENISQNAESQENASGSQDLASESRSHVRASERRQDNSNENEGGQDNPTFFESTIFYDPFEDRRIESPRIPSIEDSSSSSRPTTLAFPGPSNGESSTSNTEPQSSRVPPFVSKETSWISTPRQSPNDGFNLTPLPVPEYPEPPPAYTEVDTRVSTPAEPPRTEVVVPERNANHNANRKQIMCPYCGLRVLTLMVRESGVFTHILGLICLFSCFPLTICVYCTNCCKYKNHYCPHCNNLIAYEVPILCQNMVYSKV